MRESSDNRLIKDIPSDWEAIKLKRVVKIVTGNTPPKSQENNYAEEGVPWIKPDNLISDFVISNPKEKISEEGMKTARLIPEKSALVCCIGSVGKVSINTECCTTNQQINSIIFDQPDLLDNEFGLYVTLAAKEEYIKHSNKVVVSILNKTDQGSIKVPKPPLSKQKIIAKFLKHKTLSIDALISDKEKLIKLLEEKRQAIITETVTKGLDSEVKMKDSGVEWIGEIPEHWESNKFKRIANYIKDGTHGSFARVDDGYPLLSAKNVMNGEIIIGESESQISLGDFSEITKSGYLKEGCLLLTIVGTLGRAAIYSGEKVAFQRSVAIIGINDKNYNRFIYYVTQGAYFKRELELRTKKSAQSGVYLSDLALIPVLLPPLSEQIEISKQLDDKIFNIDKLIREIKTQIQLIKKYRQALIYEAVSGKIDVQEMMKETEQEEVSSS